VTARGNVLAFGPARERFAERVEARRHERHAQREIVERRSAQAAAPWLRELDTWPSAFHEAGEAEIRRWTSGEVLGSPPAMAERARLSWHRERVGPSELLSALAVLTCRAAVLRHARRRRARYAMEGKRTLLREAQRELLARMFLVGVARLDRAALRKDAAWRVAELMGDRVREAKDLRAEQRELRGHLRRGTLRQGPRRGQRYSERTRTYLRSRLTRVGRHLGEAEAELELLAHPDPLRGYLRYRVEWTAL